MDPGLQQVAVKPAIRRFDLESPAKFYKKESSIRRKVNKKHFAFG
jgi:hypothetical protein